MEEKNEPFHQEGKFELTKKADEQKIWKNIIIYVNAVFLLLLLLDRPAILLAVFRWIPQPVQVHPVPLVVLRIRSPFKESTEERENHFGDDETRQDNPVTLFHTHNQNTQRGDKIKPMEISDVICATHNS